jgi:hypothetical protein
MEIESSLFVVLSNFGTHRLYFSQGIAFFHFFPQGSSVHISISPCISNDPVLIVTPAGAKCYVLSVRLSLIFLSLLSLLYLVGYSYLYLFYKS